MFLRGILQREMLTQPDEVMFNNNLNSTQAY